MLSVHTADMESAVANMGLSLRATLASYAAGKALVAYMLPWFDEVQKVILFPGGENLPSRAAHTLSNPTLHACTRTLSLGCPRGPVRWERKFGRARRPHPSDMAALRSTLVD